MSVEIGMTKDSEKIHHLHDLAFRNAMRDLRVAKDFLRYYLPVRFKEIIDLNTLKIESGVYVGPELKLLATDVLFSAYTKGAKKRKIFILIEHLSSPNKIVAVRMLEYMIATWKDQFVKNRNDLPFVVSLVFYNGPTPYPHSVLIHDLFEASLRKLAKDHIFYQFELIDLNQISDEVIKKHKISCVMELLFKHVHDNKMLEALESLESRIVNLYSKAEGYVVGMLKYALQKLGNKEGKNFLNSIRRKIPLKNTSENFMVTFAEYYQKKGRQEGRKEGRQEGRREGNFEAKIEIAKNLLRKDVSIQEISKITGLKSFQIKKCCIQN